jgi:hypothetical protein
VAGQCTGRTESERKPPNLRARSFGENLFQHSGKRIHRKMTGMLRGAWQSPNRCDEIFPSYLPSLLHRFPLDQFSKQRAACHGRNASLSQEPRLHNLLTVHLYAELQNIAARWILQLHNRIRVGNFSRVPRMLEVIQHLSGVH